MKKLKLFNEDMLSIFDLQGNLLGHKAENKCNLIYKHFFYQEFKVTIMNGKEFDPTVTLKSNKVCHKGIKQLIVGHKFAGFLTFDNILYYAKTPEFIEDKINTLIEKKHVKSFTVCRNLVYLTEFGQIFIVYYQKNLNTLENEEDLIIFTLTTPIDRFFASYNFIVLLTNNDINNDKNYNKNENTNIYIFDLLSFDLKKINEPNRLRKLETPLPTIISCTVGSNICYFLTNNNILYFCDLKSIVFDRQTKEKPQIQTFDYFKNKRIIKIFSSFLSYFVIQQDNIPSIDQWDNQTVLHWASDIGFPDCVKLLKFHKITGLDLTLLDRKFLNDTLGIKSEEIQNRFLREIDLKRVITYKPLVLYAWGSNNYGQLGSSQYNNVSKPMKIMLPNIEEFDEIEKVEIGWRMTAILTKKKKLWITESTNKSKQPLLIENPHENMGEKNSRRKDSDKKKEKEDKKFLVFNGTSSSKSHKWIDITHFYSKIGKVVK